MSSSPSVPSSPEPFDAGRLLASLTESPGVYRMVDGGGCVLYVGKAKNLKKRVSSYFQKAGHGPRISLMLQQVAGVEITATRSEAEALILENTLIKKLAPKYNILFRDDKSYPYIALTAHPFPQLAFHRGAFVPGARYFGPFPGASSVRASIQLLQRTFLLRTCEDGVFAHRSRPCLMHQIHRCKAPCVGLVAAEEYGRDVRLAELFLRGRQSEVIDGLTTRMQAAADSLHFEEAAALRDQIRALQAVLHKQYVSDCRDVDADILAAAVIHGELCVNLAMIRGGLHLGDRAFFPAAGGEAVDDGADGLSAFLRQHYLDHPPPPRIVVEKTDDDEIAGVFAGSSVELGAPRNPRERAWLVMADKNARLALEMHRRSKARASGRLAALQEALAMAEAPSRIECFDISHTMGEGTVGSCVVCVDGAMRKGDYRRFNVADIQPGDDYAAMRQVLTRRYERVAAGEGLAPDLILVDGGKGQHRVAREVLAELGLGHLASIGIAKGEERKPGLETLFVHGRSEPLQLSPEHEGFHLIQEIRDEAHRFAVGGHRARRAKTRSRSRLEDIPGVGPARRRSLLAHFGGLDGIMAATVDDLCRAGGVSRRLAAVIYEHLHGH